MRHCVSCQARGNSPARSATHAHAARRCRVTSCGQAPLAAVAARRLRINGQGAKLNQADFILTLMSVFWEEGRKDLETFALAAAGPPDGKPSPKNYFINPSPDQMLRVM